MRRNVLFARKVMEDVLRYKYGREEINTVEDLLNDFQLPGEVWIPGVASVWKFDKLFGYPHRIWPHVGTMTWDFQYLPVADSIPGAADEINVFNFRKHQIPLAGTSGDVLQTVRDIYELVKWKA